MIRLPAEGPATDGPARDTLAKPVEHQQHAGLLDEGETGRTGAPADSVSLDRLGLGQGISSCTPCDDRLHDMPSGSPGRVGP